MRSGAKLRLLLTLIRASGLDKGIEVYARIRKGMDQAHKEIKIMNDEREKVKWN